MTALQQHQDARAILQHQLQLEQGQLSASADSSINVFLVAGALQEAQNGLTLRLEQHPNDAYAKAVEIELACWDPTDHRDGLAAATQWLNSQGDGALQAYVQTRHDWLSAQTLHREQVQDQASMSRLFPLAAVLLALLLAKASLVLALRITAKSPAA